jgi:formamidopyrimidine-DNA glycosylase
VPELPEVETIVRDVARLATGHTIVAVEVLRPDLIEGEPADEFAAGLSGWTIHQVSRRAKNIVIALHDQRLVVNLGMTGRLLVLATGEPHPSHPGVRFPLDDGRLLAYHDVRRFGRLQRFTRDEWERRSALLGVEPLSSEFTPEILLRKAAGSIVAIKSWLMDQRRVVGIGNIYASEALFRARIDPRRPARSLTPAEAGRLHHEVRAVLQESIDFRGTTLLDYRDAEGNRGDFATRLRVYDRDGEPCPTCGAPILRIVQAGRSTFFCDRCQDGSCEL